jgi:hypothetical protein
MEIEVNIPTLNGIKLKQYQDFIMLSKIEKDNRRLELKMVEILCDFKPEAVKRIKATSLSSIVEVLNNSFTEIPDLIKRFKIGDIEFGFIPNLEEMTLGEYIDLDGYITDFSTMHKAMSVLYRPIIKNKKSWFNRKEQQYLIEDYNGSNVYGELMKHTPLDVTLSAYFFFVSLREELLISTLNFLEKEIIQMEKTLAYKPNSQKNGDGIVQYINSLKEMLVELRKLQNLTYTNVLHI